MISRKRAARLTWLSHFDMEHLVGRLLQYGMLLCVSLAVVGFMLQEVFGPQAHLDPILQAQSIPALLMYDMRHRDATNFFPDLLIDLTISVLILIPYFRLLMSALYLGFIERDRSLLVVVGMTLLIPTVAVLTDLD